MRLSNWISETVRRMRSASRMHSNCRRSRRRRHVGRDVAALTSYYVECLEERTLLAVVGTVAMPIGDPSLVVSGEFGYLADEFQDELKVLDVTSNPAAPTVVGTVDLGKIRDPSLAVSGTTAYVATGLTSVLQVIDVSDPTAPVVSGSVSLVAVNRPAIALSGTTVYVVDDHSDQFRVIDVSNPASPTISGSVTIAGLNNISLAASGTVAYLADESRDQLFVIDAANPAAPVVSGTLSLGNVLAPSLAVSGNHVYLADAQRHQLQIVDVSNPASPVSSGSITTDRLEQPAVAVSGQTAYVAAGFSNRLMVFDVSDPANPAFQRTFALDDVSNLSVAISDSVVYVAEDHRGRIYAIDPSGPTFGDSVGLRNTRNPSVAVSGSTAYVVDDAVDQLHVIDVSDPSAPAVSGSVSLGDLQFPDLSVLDDFAYVVDSEVEQLQVIDVSNPNSPAVKSTLALGDLGRPALEVRQDVAYVIEEDQDRFLVIDISNPAAPFISGTLQLGGVRQPALAVTGNLAHVVDDELNLLRVIDVSNPANLTVIGSVSLGDIIEPSVAAVGNRVWVVDREIDQIQEIDITDPTSPVIHRRVELDALDDVITPSLTVSGSSLYLADASHNQLRIFDQNSLSHTHTEFLYPHRVAIANPSVAVEGTLAFIVDDRSDHLRIIDVDVSPPAGGPVFAGQLELDDILQPALAASGTSVYVLNRIDGRLQVIDASVPASPLVRGALSLGSLRIPSLAVLDNSAYVVDGDIDQFQIIDVTDPSNPSVSGTLALGDLGRSAMAVSQNVAYVVDEQLDQFYVIDTSNPASPSVSGMLPVGAVGDPALAVAGNHVYLVDDAFDQLQVIDVTNAASPTVLGTVGLGNLANPSIEISGSVAWVIDDHVERLQAVDVSTPASPTVIGSVGLGDVVRTRFTLAGELAYVVDGERDRVQVFDISIPARPVLAHGARLGGVEGGILSNPDIAILGSTVWVVDDTNSRLEAFDASSLGTTPAVDLTVSTNTGTEADGTVVTVTATTNSPVTGNQTIDVVVTGTATIGDDFSVTDNDPGSAGIQIEILNGQTTGNITFTVVDDAEFESSETATLTIANPSSRIRPGLTRSQTITIADNEARIGDYVWNDLDRDGVQDLNETGRDGVTVNLLNAAGTTQLDTTTTSGGGLYDFVVAAGTYVVEFVNPTDSLFSPWDAGAPNDDTRDSDADPITARTGPITVLVGQDNDTVDAGLVLDLTAPIVGTTSTTTTDDTPVLHGTVDDAGAAISVMVEGKTYAAVNDMDGTWTLADNTISPALGRGVHNVTVTATDAAGNVGTDSTTNELRIAVQAFDFGAAGSPVQAGFTQVLTTDIVPGSPMAGDFGWVSSTGLSDRDRTNVTSHRDRDYHKTNNASSTFQTVLANGEYNITFVIGSGADPRNNVGVLIEDTQVATVTTTPGQFHTQTELIMIADGLLDFEIRKQGSTSAGINAVIILPATNEPRLDATDTQQFHRLGDGPVVVDSGFVLTDPDDATLTGAEVRITTGFVSGEDVLGFTDQNGITGNYDGATGVLTLTGDSSVSNYEVALRSVTFDSTGTTSGSRALQFAASDGTTGTGYDARSLTVLPAGGASLDFDFGDTSSPVEPGYVRVTVDQTFNATLGFGWLGDAVTNGLSARDRGVPDALRQDYHKIGSGTMTFAVSLPDSTYDVTVTIGSSQDPRHNVGVFLENTQVGTVSTSSGQFSAQTHRVAISDGRLEIKLQRLGSSGVGLNGLRIAEVTGAPTVALSDGSAVFEAGGGAIAVDDLLTVSDIDSTDLTGAVVRIIGGFNMAADTLLFTDQLGINGSYAAATGVLTLTGNATVAGYQAALRTVQFNSTDNTGTRTVEVEVNDGSETGIDTRDILVTTPFSGTARYDFGTPTSPVEAGFTGVDENSAFSSAIGFGWLSTTGLESRERLGPVPLDERHDYVKIGSGSMTFAVSLPNGDYDVQLTIGSSENARNNVGVILEAAQVDTISTAVNQFATPTHRVTVSDNRLEVKLERQGASSASINALVITDV